MDGAAQDQRSAPLLSSDGLKVLASGDLHMSECLFYHTLGLCCQVPRVCWARCYRRIGLRNIEADETTKVLKLHHKDIHTGVPKKMSFLGKTAITTFKIIQNAKAGGVLENSGYLLPDEH